MKKLISILTFVILISFMFSCTDNTTETLENNDKIFNQIKNITEKFIDSQKENNTNITNQTRVNDPNVWLADCEAGLESYLENGDKDQAISVGTAASAKYSSGIINPNPGNPIENVENINNEYDYVGKYHAEILQYGILDNSHILYPNGIFNYQNSIDFIQQFLISKNIFLQPSSIMSLNEFNTFYNNVENIISSSNYKFSKIILNLENQGKLSHFESQILYMYYSAQESSTSLNDFIQFSIQIENIISNSSYSEEIKELFLFTMATTRHDINLWNPY